MNNKTPIFAKNLKSKTIKRGIRVSLIMLIIASPVGDLISEYGEVFETDCIKEAIKKHPMLLLILFY